jgi:hypothetical protein
MPGEEFSLQGRKLLLDLLAPRTNERHNSAFEPFLHSQSTFDVPYDGLRPQQGNHPPIRVAIA